MAVALALLALGGKAPAEPVALLGCEPAGVLGAVGQPDENGDAGQHAGDALQQEKPLPAGQRVAEEGRAIKAKQPAGQRRTDAPRESRGREEPGDGARLQADGNPVGEIEQDAGREAGLGRAEQEAQQVETPLPLDAHHQRGDHAPGDHDARHPEPRPDAIEYQVARDLEDKVTDEKDAGAKPVDSFGETEVVAHGQLGKADVDAVEVVK